MAICIDLNIAAQGKTANKAIQECGELIKEYLEYVRSKYPKNIKKYIPRHASSELMNEYYSLNREISCSPKMLVK